MDSVLKVLRVMCRRVGTPLALSVLGHAERGEWRSVQQIKIAPESYPNASSYWMDAMCVDFLRKINVPGTETCAAQAAMDTFLEAERVCYGVNRKIRTLIKDDMAAMAGSDWALLEFLIQWREKVRDVMGKVPERLHPRFSSGATTGSSRRQSTILDKMSATPSRYSHSTFVVDHMFYQTMWGDVAHERRLYPQEVSANEYFQVPKTGLTARSCCKEAVINVCYQLGAARVLRARLRKKLSIDLEYDQEKHQMLAREGSTFGNWATLDMSSASDRWARELIRFLVPWDWGVLLDALRATHTKIGNKRLYLEKFSSMGNGFTFELETILFATLARVVMDKSNCSGEIHCYGDDLIVPTSVAIDVCSWLRVFGQEPNLRKTFTEGPFRESCGGDFFAGMPVNTVKLEKIPEAPQDWFSLLNNLKRVCYGDEQRWALLKPVWEQALRCLPPQYRNYLGPSFLGDTVIHGDPPEEGWPRMVWSITPTPAGPPLVINQWPGLAIVAFSLYTRSPVPRLIPGDVSHERKRVSAYRASDYLPGTPFVAEAESTRERRKFLMRLGDALITERFSRPGR